MKLGKLARLSTEREQNNDLERVFEDRMSVLETASEEELLIEIDDFIRGFVQTKTPAVAETLLPLIVDRVDLLLSKFTSRSAKEARYVWLDTMHSFVWTDAKERVFWIWAEFVRNERELFGNRSLEYLLMCYLGVDSKAANADDDRQQALSAAHRIGLERLSPSAEAAVVIRQLTSGNIEGAWRLMETVRSERKDCEPLFTCADLYLAFRRGDRERAEALVRVFSDSPFIEPLAFDQPSERPLLAEWLVSVVGRDSAEVILKRIPDP